jgi:hypothetical protein
MRRNPHVAFGSFSIDPAGLVCRLMPVSVRERLAPGVAAKWRDAPEGDFAQPATKHLGIRIF